MTTEGCWITYHVDISGVRVGKIFLNEHDARGAMDDLSDRVAFLSFGADVSQELY